MIIDFHTHAFPDKLAVKAMKTLQDIAGARGTTDGTVGGLIASMDDCGIDRSVICNIATNPGQQEHVNQFADDTNRSFGQRLSSLWSVHPCSPNIGETLEKAKSHGIKGIKIHPDYMGFRITDPAFDALFDACDQLGMFIVTHSGFDPYSPRTIHATSEMLKKRIEEHPRLTLIAAHFGCNGMWDEFEEDLIGSNIYFDTSLPLNPPFSREQARRMILHHDPNRILFGSDIPWATGSDAIRFIESLRLPDDLTDNIMCRNAQSLLRIGTD